MRDARCGSENAIAILSVIPQCTRLCHGLLVRSIVAKLQLMKPVFYLLVVMALSSLSARAAEDAPDQSSPQAVITSFFKALKANDEKTIIKLLAPKRKEIADDAARWKQWLSAWRACGVDKFVDAPKPESSSKYDETLAVPVEYKCEDRPKFKDAIKVSRVGKIWYWDEN